MTLPNWTNPCERAEALRRAYYELVSGTKAYKITYTANGVTRDVSYAVIDTKLLLSEIRTADEECAAQQSGTPTRRRYAIGLGARRPLVPDFDEGD